MRLDRRERCIGQVQLKEKRRMYRTDSGKLELCIGTMYRTGVHVRGKRRMDRTG